MVTGPINPGPQTRPGPVIQILRIKQSVEGKIVIPLQPPFGPDRATDVRLHHHRARVHFPRPPEVRRALNFGPGRDVAELDREARFLGGILTALCGNGVLLIGQALSGRDLAVLEYGLPVAEDEVDGAGDPALFVELAHRVGVQGVLVPVDAAPEYDGPVGIRTVGDGLVLSRASGVLERYVPGYESLPPYGFICNNVLILNYQDFKFKL